MLLLCFLDKSPLDKVKRTLKMEKKKKERARKQEKSKDKKKKGILSTKKAYCEGAPQEGERLAQTQQRA